MMFVALRIYAFSILFCVFVPLQTSAAELLLNRNFEQPVAPLNGNNFYASIPNWTLLTTPTIATPANIVVPFAAYANNPQTTPTGGGRQYFDMNGVGGIARQNVTFATSGIVSMSTWFSVRDFPQNLNNAAIKLRNSSNVVVASATVAFTTADPIGLWKQAIINGISLPAGTYTFDIEMDNFHNIDLASLDIAPAAPALQITKSSDKTAPVVLGETINYTFLVKNVGNVPLNNVYVSDSHNGYGTAPIPGNETLFLDVAPFGSSTNSVTNNNLWDTLGPGDTIKLTATYVVVQSDIDYRQ